MIKNLYTSTVLKAFDILGCFEDGRRELGLKEISERIGMPPSSIYHIVSSMEYIGLVYQNDENKKYRVGPQYLELARKGERMAEYQRIAVRYMKELRRETGENVNLAISRGEDILLVHKEECSHMLRPNFQLHTPFRAYKTGLGMVLLAEKTDVTLEWIYQNNRADIGLEWPAFLERIQQVRRDGYAFDDQWFCTGLRCLAAPVRGPGGNALFAVSVSAPINRMDWEACQRNQQLLLRCTETISNELQSIG